MEKIDGSGRGLRARTHNTTLNSRNRSSQEENFELGLMLKLYNKLELILTNEMRLYCSLSNGENFAITLRSRGKQIQYS